LVVNVPAVTVDDLLVEIGWDRPDFIKMDIEGSEVVALRGMAGLLAGPNAPPIYYESNGHTLAFYGQSTKNLKASAANAGYVNYLIESDKLVPVSTEDFQGQTCVDYLALKTVPSTLTVTDGLPLAVQISHLRESVEHPEVAGRFTRCGRCRMLLPLSVSTRKRGACCASSRTMIPPAKYVMPLLPSEPNRNRKLRHRILRRVRSRALPGCQRSPEC
jgi:hypothetical protein